MLSFGSPLFEKSDCRSIFKNICKTCSVMMNRCVSFGGIYSTYVHCDANSKFDINNDYTSIDGFAISAPKQRKRRSLKVANKIYKISSNNNLKEDTSSVNQQDVETLWKMYREANDTIEDFQRRLFDSSPRKNHSSSSVIKNKCKSEEETSDSETSIEREDSSSSSDETCKESEDVNIADYLNVEIQEDPASVISLDRDDIYDTTNCSYDVPRLKSLASADCYSKDIYQQASSRPSRPVIRALEQKTIQRRKQPIICEMNGVRTYNYNSEDSYEEIKFDDRFTSSRLSFTSDDKEEPVPVVPVNRKRDARKRKFSPSMFPTLNLSSESEDSNKSRAGSEKSTRSNSPSSSSSSSHSRSCSCSTTSSKKKKTSSSSSSSSSSTSIGLQRDCLP